MKTNERGLGVAEIDGWHIDSITTTRFEAYKDGETVRLDSDTIAGIVELIKMRGRTMSDKSTELTVADGLADFRCKTNDSDLVYRGEVRRILHDQKVVHKERAVNRLTAVKPVVKGEWVHPVPTDGDCVSRKAILSKVTYFEHDNLLAVCVQDIIDAPAIEQPMSAKELLHIEIRMFGKYLEAWSEYSGYVVDGKVEEAVAFAERWAREHPERSGE